MEQVGDIMARAVAEQERRNQIPTVSTVLSDGSLLDMVFDPERQLSAYALWRNGAWELVPDYLLPDGRRLVPYSARNNLVQHEVVLFPLGPEEYGSTGDLLSLVQDFIHRYCDLSPRFERLSAYYVLLSWVYDAFNELPYLRVRGDPGTGKTRFLLTVGSLCYKPVFASGASTVSPIFRILDAVRGTLVLDESDFRKSDERADVVKILNNGNCRGFPVLRSEAAYGTKEFNPRAYHVFGPKLVATRSFFDDPALESRFLTEEMSGRTLRDDIPINLSGVHAEEARRLRNHLLLFRFRNFKTERRLEQFVDRSLEPRLSQIFAPLLSIIEEEQTRGDLRDLAGTYNRELTADRGLGVEAQLLELIRDLWRSRDVPPAIMDLARVFSDRQGPQGAHLTPKRIGWILRRKLGLEIERTREGYRIGGSEEPRLLELYHRYGISDSSSSTEAEKDGESPPGKESVPR
jgi:hypothetical protein